MLTRDQVYAEKVFNQVTQLLHRPKAERTQYGSMAHKLPVLIRTAGLAQALAFVEARGKDPHRDLLKHIELTLYGSNSNPNRLIVRSRLSKLAEYQQLTHNTLKALLWYKRFAQSVLDVDASESEDDNAAVNAGESGQ